MSLKRIDGKFAIIVLLFLFFQGIGAETVALGELHTSGGLAGFQYGASPGTFIVDLTHLPHATEPIPQKFIKIANDIAAQADPAEKMPEFEVRLEQKTGGGGFTSVNSVVLNAEFKALNNGYYSIRLEPDPALNGDFTTEKIYTITVTAPNGGWATGTDEERILIGVKNNAGADRTYFGAAGDTAAEAEVPYIKVLSPPVDFGEVLVGGERPDDCELIIANIGTGLLTINSPPPVPSHPAFSWPGISTPYTINPLASPLTSFISFDPRNSNLLNASLGPIDETMTFSNNSINSPDLDVALKATIVKLEFVMLYDISGSMALTPDGNSTANPANQRLGQAKAAGSQIISLLSALEGEAVRAGLVTFPRQEKKCEEDGPTAFTKIPGPGNTTNVNLDTLSMVGNEFSAAFGTGSDSLQTTYGIGIMTPLAEGLKVSHGTDVSNFGITKWTDNVYAHRAIVLFADGAHNCDSIAYPQTTDDWTEFLLDTEIPDSRKIRIFTIPYGIPGYSHVDQESLEELADASGGGMYYADVTDYNSLSKMFRAALIEWRSDWNEIVDPAGSLIAGEQDKVYDICIDDDAYRIAFIVDWDKMSANAIDFVLEGPDGVVSASSPDVEFHAGQNYALYVVKGDTAKGYTGSDNWRLQLSGGTGSLSGETINYSYSVITKTRIALNTTLTSRSINTTQKQLFEVKIDGIKHMAQDAKVVCKYDMPKQSYGTYLSSMKNFDSSWLIKSAAQPLIHTSSDTAGQPAGIMAPFEIWGEPASLLQRKIYALYNFAKQPFDDQRTEGEIQLNDNGLEGDKLAGDGIYSAYLPVAYFDGLARYRVFLTLGSCIRRELNIDKYIHVDLRSEDLGKYIKFQTVKLSPFAPPELIESLKKQPPRDILYKSIVFTPRDEFGNYWGPGHADRISFAVKNAEPVGPVVDNLDGSYIQVIRYNRKTPPSVKVTARGVVSNEIPMISPGNFELSAHAGYSLLHGNLGQYSGFSGVVDFGYRLNANLSAEALVGFHYFLQDDSGNSYYLTNASLNAKYTLPLGIFGVFVNGGAGWYFPPAGSSSAGWNAGGGVMASLSRNLALELGYNYHNVLNAGNIRFSSILLGIRYGM